MSLIKFRQAISKKECEEAYNLAQQVFLDKSEYACKIMSKKLSWQEFGLDNPQNLIVGFDDKKLIGLLRICPIEMTYKGQHFKVAGLSSICISPQYRGSGLGRELMELSLEIIDKLDFDFSYLIARRAVDNFYGRFGFVGASSYQSLNIKFDTTNSNKIVCFDEFNSNHEQFYRKCFDWSYRECFGAMKRPPGFWANAIQRIKLMNLIFHEVTIRSEPIGYLILDEKNIFECAFSNKLSKKIVEDIFTNFHSYKIIIPHQHSLVKSLKPFDVEFFSRRCIYGGHMLRWSSKFKRPPIDISIGVINSGKKNNFFNISLMDEV